MTISGEHSPGVSDFRASVRPIRLSIREVNGIAQRLGFIIVDATVIAVTWRAIWKHVVGMKDAKMGVTTGSVFLRQGQWLVLRALRTSSLTKIYSHRRRLFSVRHKLRFYTTCALTSPM